VSDRDVEFEESTACDSCGEEGAYDFMGDYLCARCADRNSDAEAMQEQHRAALTRALTAQAWGVACSIFCEPGMTHSVLWMIFSTNVAGGLTKDIARLAAPADLAAEILDG